MACAFICLRQCKDITVFLTMHYGGNPGRQVLKAGYDGTQGMEPLCWLPVTHRNDSLILSALLLAVFTLFSRMPEWTKLIVRPSGRKIEVKGSEGCGTQNKLLAHYAEKRRIKIEEEDLIRFKIEKRSPSLANSILTVQNLMCKDLLTHPLLSGSVFALLVFGIQYVLRCK